METKVLTGLERFAREGPAVAGLADGARLGLVVHPASVDATLRHAVDLLGARANVVRLFAPEHGVRGEAQDMESVDEPSDAATGIPIVSLYGRSEESLRPRPEHLLGLDAIVYDLQDVGSRYYTFVSTLSYLMEAARDRGIPVVVLDRPNPIGGREVEGPVLRKGFESFVGVHPVPVRHGMTTAELARLFNDRFGIGCDLRVVPMSGWRRFMHHEDTGLPWVAPSPNMPTPDTARVYPGGCLVEGTNLSEARGTTRPFELAGAPWLDARALAESLNGAGLDGALFRATAFRPMFQKHAGASCHGVQVHVTDRERFRPFLAYLVLLREAIRQNRGRFDWRRDAYEFVTDRLAIDLLLGRDDLRPLLEAGAAAEDMAALWKDDLAAFAELRRSVLLYED